MKDLDEELIDRTKTVFENYDDGESNVGWAMLREKYPKKSDRRFPFYWLLGVAASLLLIFGLWFLKKPVQDAEQSITNKQQKPNIKQLPTKRGIGAAPIIDGLAQSITPILGTTLAKQDSLLPPPNNEAEKAYLDLGAQNPIEILQIEGQKRNLLVNVGIGNQNWLDARTTESPSINQQLTLKPINIYTGSQGYSKSNMIDTALIQKHQLANTNLDSVKHKTTADFLQEQSKQATSKIAQKANKIKNHKNAYEVFTGTFLNYYADNDIRVNAGFGLNASLKISNSVFLSVGAGISQNKMAYQNYMPPVGTDKKQSSYMANSTYGSTTVLQASAVTKVKLSAQLLSLDLPISLKIYPSKKQNFYFSTGFNSNTYFAQKYNYTYTLTTTSSTFATSQFNREETEKIKFRGFDFANSAIFAIGINQSLGKTNSIVFEPYFKPAIGNMGDKNLKINTVGLNLKFSFQSRSKK